MYPKERAWPHCGEELQKMTGQVVRLMRNYRNWAVELLPVITASESVNL